jgi:hypothetical protein
MPGRHGRVHRPCTRTRVIATATFVTMLVTACTQIVGPARTRRDFELKATTTAESVASSVQTVRLLMQLGRNDDAFAAYLATMASESEDGATAAAGTFSGIQPPDARSDRLRTRLLALTDPATAHLADVRIRARRAELGHAAPELERALARDARRLQRFSETHG